MKSKDFKGLHEIYWISMQILIWISLWILLWISFEIHLIPNERLGESERPHLNQLFLLTPCGFHEIQYNVDFIMDFSVDLMDLLWNPPNSIWETRRKWGISLQSVVLIDFRWISCEIHVRNLPSFMKSVKIRKYGLLGCRFHVKSWDIAFPLHLDKLKFFLNYLICKVFRWLSWNPHEIRQISWNPHEICWISWNPYEIRQTLLKSRLWTFVWWPIIGLSKTKDQKCTTKLVS